MAYLSVNRAIDGRSLAESLLTKVAEMSADIADVFRRPALAIIMVGNDPASSIYVRNKERACKKAGVSIRVLMYPDNVSEPVIAAQIQRLNDDPTTDGIVLQLPLPEGMNARRLLDRISPDKDVDGLTTVNQGALWTGAAGIAPCTAEAVMGILYKQRITLARSKVVIVGRSNVVGKPLAAMLTAENATVTLCHSYTKNLGGKMKNADIVVAAAGVPGLVKPAMIKEGAALIDVGITRINDRVVGDIDPECYAKAGCFTPVPGGVGPMTVACLVRNVVEAAETHRVQEVRSWAGL